MNAFDIPLSACYKKGIGIFEKPKPIEWHDQVTDYEKVLVKPGWSGVINSVGYEREWLTPYQFRLPFEYNLLNMTEPVLSERIVVNPVFVDLSEFKWIPRTRLIQRYWDGVSSLPRELNFRPAGGGAPSMRKAIARIEKNYEAEDIRRAVLCMWMVNGPFAHFGQWLLLDDGFTPQQKFKSFCDECIRKVLQTSAYEPEKHPFIEKLSDFQALFMYRAQRALTPGEGSAIDIKDVEELFLPPSTQMNTREAYEFSRSFINTYSIVVDPFLFAPFSSVQSCYEVTGKNGGFNAMLSYMAEIESKTRKVNLGSEGERRDFLSAINFATEVILTPGRLPLAFYTIAFERNHKRRIPGVPEFCAGIIARYIGVVTKKVISRIFPGSFKNKPEKLKKGNFYLSGDYKKSTQYIAHDVSAGATLAMFDQYEFQGGLLEREIHGKIRKCISILCGPHIITIDEGYRREVQKKWPPPRIIMEKYVEYKKFKNALVYSGWSQESPDSNLNCVYEPRKPALYMTQPKWALLPQGWRQSMFQYNPPDGKVTSCGQLMCYGFSSNSLFLINALPHYETYLLQSNRDFGLNSFSIKGDDNASSHQSMETIEILESRKTPLTGMKPHDTTKSHVSRVGYVIGEYVYKMENKKLVMLPYISVNSIFPGGRLEIFNKNHWITQPRAVMKEFRDSIGDQYKETFRRIMSVVWDTHRSKYTALFRETRISPFVDGELFGDFAPSRGFQNPVNTDTSCFRVTSARENYFSWKTHIKDPRGLTKGRMYNVFRPFSFMSHKMTRKSHCLAMSTIDYGNQYFNAAPIVDDTVTFQDIVQNMIEDRDTLGQDEVWSYANELHAGHEPLLEEEILYVDDFEKEPKFCVIDTRNLYRGKLEQKMKSYEWHSQIRTLVREWDLRRPTIFILEGKFQEIGSRVYCPGWGGANPSPAREIMVVQYTPNDARGADQVAEGVIKDLIRNGKKVCVHSFDRDWDNIVERCKTYRREKKLEAGGIESCRQWLTLKKRRESQKDTQRAAARNRAQQQSVRSRGRGRGSSRSRGPRGGRARSLDTNWRQK